MRSSEISGAEPKDKKGIPKNKIIWPSKDKANAMRMIRNDFACIRLLF
jgi:hypothetical protein